MSSVVRVWAAAGPGTAPASSAAKPAAVTEIFIRIGILPSVWKAKGAVKVFPRVCSARCIRHPHTLPACWEGLLAQIPGEGRRRECVLVERRFTLTLSPQARIGG